MPDNAAIRLDAVLAPHVGSFSRFSGKTVWRFAGARSAEVQWLSRVGAATPEGPGTSALAISPSRPNPAVVRLTILEDGRIRVEVFDALGRAVTTLVERPLAAGAHHIVWDGHGAAGVYVIRATMGEMSRRALVVR